MTELFSRLFSGRSIILFSLFALALAGCGESDKPAKASESRPATPTVAAMKRPTLDLTMGDFFDRFNAVGESAGFSFRLDRPEVDTSSSHYNVAKQEAGAFAFTFHLSKGKEALEAVVMVARSESDRDVADTIGSMAGVIAAIEPGMSPEERGSVFQDLGLLSGADLGDHRGRAVRGNVKYFVRSDDAGIRFGAEPI